MRILSNFNKKNLVILKNAYTFVVESKKNQSIMKNTLIMNEQLVYKLQCEAACLLKEKVLLLNGITIIPKEIEIYYYEKGVFEDGSVHQNELQQNNKSHFYIHRWGTKKTDSYKGGNYPGIDLVVSGTENVYYTFLIRSALINGKPIIGPHKVLMEIMSTGLFNNFEEIENIPVVIQPSSVLGDVLFSDRINLGNNAGEFASLKFRAVVCDNYFRDSKYPQKEKLVTIFLLSSKMNKEDALAFSKKYLGYIPIKVKNNYD